MFNKIPFKLALYISLSILGLILAMHVLIMTKVIPYTAVWGGKLQNDEDMVHFETMSILINTFIVVVILLKAKLFGINVSMQVLNVFLWVFVLLFTFNTIGNLLSKSSTETLIFTPLTFLLAILCSRLALEKN